MGVLTKVTWNDGQCVVVEIRRKGDWRRSHLWLPSAFWVVGVFSSNARREWNERFATTVGTTVYMPASFDEFNLLEEGKQVSPRWIGLIAHEATHAVQWTRSKLMPLFYAFLPQRRALYEIEAILRGQMAVCPDVFRVRTAEHFADRLSGPWYLWAGKRNEILLLLLSADREAEPTIEFQGVTT